MGVLFFCAFLGAFLCNVGNLRIRDFHQYLRCDLKHGIRVSRSRVNRRMNHEIGIHQHDSGGEMGNRRDTADDKAGFLADKIGIGLADFLFDERGDFFIIHAIFAAGNDQHGFTVFGAKNNRLGNLGNVTFQCIGCRLCRMGGRRHDHDGVGQARASQCRFHSQYAGVQANVFAWGSGRGRGDERRIGHVVDMRQNCSEYPILLDVYQGGKVVRGYILSPSQKLKNINGE